MIPVNAAVIVLVGECVLYLLILVATLIRGGLQERPTRALVLYVVVLGLWTLGETLWRLGWFSALTVNPFVMARMPAYGALVLSLLFLHLTRSFLRLAGRGRNWWLLGAALAAALLVLDNNLLGWPPVLWSGAGWVIPRDMPGADVLLGGWLVFMGGAAFMMARAYWQAQQPLHRNRLLYWPLAWALTALGGTLLLLRVEMLGGGFLLLLLGTLFAAYVTLTHRLSDVRLMARRALSFFIITCLTVALYTAGFLATHYAFQSWPGYNPVLAGAFMALILAVLFDPLLGLIQRLVNRLIVRTRYDSSRMVREYSASISNILDLEHLGVTVLGLVNETLGIRSGALLVVHHQPASEDDAEGCFNLRAVATLDADEDLLPGALAADSPAASYLRQEHRPLTQYDIDLLPRFRPLSDPERDWLASLNVDVYTPICAQGEWIGLLALGPKLSGDRYFDDDLVLLSTLADQTAVAFENARLVTDLVKAHADLQQAFTALDQANRQLQELDKLKSAFIGVVTHELRTPFANISFSLELLKRYAQEYMSDDLRQQVEHVLAGVQTARMMVDNLIVFATFISKQGELHLTELDFAQTIQHSLRPLRTLAESKQISIHLEIPADLPPVRGDRERLGDAVYHLAHNALKFTGPGGQVWVRCEASGPVLGFEVQDTGVGVPAERLPGLWDGFTQMADPLRRGQEGLGLGLVLVKYIVNAHGGNVWAQSRVGEGSRFGFYVPLPDH